MTEESLLSVEFIYCACGCGFTTSKYFKDNGKLRKDRPKRFIAGHQSRILLKEKYIQDKSSRWKGDNVGLDALHQYIRKYNPPTKLCQICNLVPPKDLANITGIYNREFKNWKYLCRKCHIEFDNKIERDPKNGRFRKVRLDSI